MDPVGTNADGKVIYKIENMDRAAIRSNNYLAGYVSQTNVTNDHVRVDGMTVNNARPDSHDVPTHNKIVGDAIVDLQGATITSGSKLYKLGYSSSGVPDLNGNLSAAEVFYRNPDPNVTSTTPCYLNELWDDATNTFHTNVPRNEVLVRYDDNGNVIWAISFREFRSVNSSNVGTRDLAQTVWYNMLPAPTQETGETKFMGIDVNKTGGDGTIANPYQNTITHAQAVEAAKQALMKVVDVKSTSGSVVTYTLQKRVAPSSVWTAVGTTDKELMDEAQWLAKTNEQVIYQLAITLNQGTPIVYNLVKNPAETQAVLTSNSANFTVNPYNNEIVIVNPNQPWPITDFLAAFQVSGGATVEWTFTRWNGQTFTATGVGADAVFTGMPTGTTTSELKEISAIVTSQDGKVVAQYATATGFVLVTVNQNIHVWDAKTNTKLNPYTSNGGNSAYRLAKGAQVYFVTYGEGKFNDGTKDITATIADSVSTSETYQVTGAVTVTFIANSSLAPTAVIVTDDSRITLPAVTTIQGTPNDTNTVWTATFDGIVVADGFELVTPTPAQPADPWSAAVTKNADGTFKVVFTMNARNANVYSALTSGKNTTMNSASIQAGIKNDKDVGGQITKIVDTNVKVIADEANAKYYLSGTPSKVYTQNTTVTDTTELEGLRQFWFGEGDQTPANTGAAALAAMKAEYNNADFAIIPISTPNGVLFFAVHEGGPTSKTVTAKWNYDDGSVATYTMDIDLSGVTF